MLPEHARHHHEYKIRLTDAQAKALEGNAELAGVPVSVYLRLLVTKRLVESAYGELGLVGRRLEVPEAHG